MFFSFPWILLLIENDEDRLFLEGLYMEYHSLLYGQALRILKSPEAAQDAVSDAILALTKKIPLLRTLPCNKLRAYLVITVKHHAINQYHRAKRETTGGEIALEDLAAPERTEDALLEQAGVERIKNAILALPPREKDVMLMRYFREMTDEEMAAELGLRAVSVRVHLTRARKHLAILLQQEEGEQ